MKILIYLILSSILSIAENNSPRTAVHILDYIAGDYPGAVEKGKIINPAEYEEQLELLASAKKIISTEDTLKTKPELLHELSQLEKLIKGLAPSEDIFLIATQTKQKIIAFTNLQVTPKTWPSLSLGKKVYEANCVSCHGVTGRGDGPAAQGLNPPVADFKAPDRHTFLSPSKVFNTARVGIEGTSMGAFNKLTDEELWAVSFYIFSLKQGAKQAGSYSEWQKEITLNDAATLTDPELIKKISAPSENEKNLALASIRNFSQDSGSAHNQYLDFAVNSLEGALIDYKNKNTDAAQNKALKAYLEGIEPIEPKLKAKSPTLLRDIENQMLSVRQKMNAQQPAAIIEQQVQITLTTVGKIRELFDKDNSSSPGFTYFLSLSIILREALEALLVIITLLGVLRATGSAVGQKWLHAGWLSAVLLGIGLWFFSGWIINLSGASREILEGSVALVAVAILIYIGFWLHSKTEITKWNNFIKQQVQSALSTKNLWGLAIIAFTAVAREALEVVLFLRTILIDVGTNKAAQNAVYGGIFSSVFFVVIMAWLLLKYSAKVPVRKLFIYSSAIIGALAIILTGKGIHSIQESGLISITPLPFDLRIDLLGLYPTLESLGMQLAVVALLSILWNWGKKPAKLDTIQA